MKDEQSRCCFCQVHSREKHQASGLHADERLTYWGTADLIAGNSPQRSYFVNEHSDGDRGFGTFEGRIASTGGQVTIEGAWIFTGGTGKLEGLTGGGSYKGKMTSPVEVENTLGRNVPDRGKNSGGVISWTATRRVKPCCNRISYGLTLPRRGSGPFACLYRPSF